MDQDQPFAEPFKVKMVEEIKRTTREYRETAIKKAQFNLFNLPSSDVYIDLLTDSGTGAMSDKQWSAMMTGDESYAGSRSFFDLQKSIFSLTGYEHVIPTHQGRGAENVLFSVLVKKGSIIPGNSHFDTTKGHIEFREGIAVDCTIAEANKPDSLFPFKGNLDLVKLKKVLDEQKANIPFVLITVTCNTGGGQPVSMQNIKEVHALTSSYGIPILFDIARFAENCYFIKTREEQYKDWHIKAIVNELFSYGEGALMSAKKDAIANIGGFIALKSKDLYNKASMYSILFEGFLTYGGLAGRDMAAIAQGLQEATEFEYLEGRIKQVEYLGSKLIALGIPILQPIGGHAVYVDAKRFFPHIPQNCFPAQVLGIELYREAGIRGVEIGTVLADRDPITRENRYPGMELLRLAIPRRVYTNNHMDVIAWGLKKVWERRDKVHGLKITYEAPLLRHFSCAFEECTTDKACSHDCIHKAN